MGKLRGGFSIIAANLLPQSMELLEPGNSRTEYSQISLYQPATESNPSSAYSVSSLPCSMGREPSDVPSVDYWFWESKRGLARSSPPPAKLWLRTFKLHLPVRNLSPIYIGPLTRHPSSKSCQYELKGIAPPKI